MPLDILLNKIAYQTYQMPLLSKKNHSDKSHISKIFPLLPLTSSLSNQIILKCCFLMLFKEINLNRNVSYTQWSSYAEYFCAQWNFYDKLKALDHYLL